MHNWIPYSSLTNEQCKDAGMALCLICLLIGWFGKINGFYAASIIILVIDMIWPAVFKPFAWVWFGFSFILGSIMSKVVLSVIFFVIVTPISLIRKVLGDDPLKLKTWKQSGESAFHERNITFTKKDVEKPF